MHLIIAPKETEVRLSWYAAIKYCQGLTTDGHTDWQLPNIYDLGQLSIEYPTEFLKDEYWSSSERWKDSPGAYFIHLGLNEPMLSCWKEKKLLVRAIRKLKCK
jgi:Protein of unknown function (DUF1566)